MGDDVRALKADAANRLRNRRAAEAAELFERLTKLEPDEPNHWFNLGYSRRVARMYQPALDAYAEALKRNVRDPQDVHINRAAILSEHLHDIPAAAEELRAAVAANPRAATAWLNLGNLAEDVGDTDQAKQAYARALEVDPGNGRAAGRLAGLHVHEGHAERAITMLREAAARQWRSAQEAAEVHFALGNALDAAGDYSAAFAAVAEGNRLGLAGRNPNLRYDPAAMEELVAALIALPPTTAADPASAGATPIFICGMFRSGSTLVEQLLARHPQITAGGELEFIPSMVREELQPYPQVLETASGERLRALRDEYLEQVRRLFPEAKRVTDKRPDNFLHIGLIKALFPGARIVHTVRNPLDNILSVFFLYFADTVTYSLQLADIAHYYGQYRRLMGHWQERFGPDIHDVDYDVLVGDARMELQPLLAFLDLEWDEACLSHDATSAVRTASNWQVRKPLHARSSGRWRHYAREIESVRRQLIDAGLLTGSGA